MLPLKKEKNGWSLYQIKNRSNSENSSSKRVRKEIKKNKAKGKIECHLSHLKAIQKFWPKTATNSVNLTWEINIQILKKL